MRSTLVAILSMFVSKIFAFATKVGIGATTILGFFSP